MEDHCEKLLSGLKRLFQHAKKHSEKIKIEDEVIDVRV